MHVPSALAPSAAAHTSHAEPHALSQQKPSWQKPDAQTAQPATRQSSPGASLHSDPCALRGMQLPFALQYAEGLHAASVVHDVGHEVAAPSHRYAPHEGLPAYAAEAGAQVPSVEVPRELAQTSQGLLQAELQQNPSTQLPD